MLCEVGDKQSALIRGVSKVESVVREPRGVSLFGQRHSLHGTEETEGRHWCKIQVGFKLLIQLYFLFFPQFIKYNAADGKSSNPKKEGR